jgi:rubredoxin
MVSKTVRDDGTWYACDACGLLFDTKEGASEHEKNCNAEEPTYLQ